MPAGIQPAELPFFVALATAGSLSAAARQLGVTTAAVSKRLAAVEARLGMPLVNRTTRRLSVTPEGEVLLLHARRILADIEALDDLMEANRESPRGLLRINATFGFGRIHVAPAIIGFTQKYQDVDVRLVLTEAPQPFAEDAFDIGFWFGEPPETRVIARRIASNEGVLCASPAYLDRHGTPTHPRDLYHHHCIDVQQGPDACAPWRMFPTDPVQGEPEVIKIRGGLATNDGESAVLWALAGLGIVKRSGWVVDHHLKAGRLVKVLPDWEMPGGGIHALYARRHLGSHRVKLFLDHLADTLPHLA
ncbi:LysR family transcriptional regulator [Luteibacter aegosomaticola]|uniref:LysR family transcriptional regulator n=1 Tax=Luteibacter aegosomaticola TaxID=2911538 RepID=UPI001FF97272|nr:LysR family transcriptional regulator [Luteibacter aegosomaticola]UPG90504.1 LysR family transcriptional regulator [Luteibacter aegosomaticola]